MMIFLLDESLTPMLGTGRSGISAMPSILPFGCLLDNLAGRRLIAEIEKAGRSHRTPDFKKLPQPAQWNYPKTGKICA